MEFDLEYLTPKARYSQNKFIPDDIFDDVPQSKVRFKKPIVRRKFQKPNQKPKLIEKKIIVPKNLKKVTISKVATVNSNLFDNAIIVGNIVEHQRFGKGEVVQLEGVGPNKKAEIKFAKFGNKKLLLQFAKLRVIG